MPAKLAESGRRGRNRDCEFTLRFEGASIVQREPWRMFVHNMTEAECRHALETASVGRLACVHDNQPYVVPTYFVYHEHHLYATSTLGQKIEWMRANPLVCLEVDQITSHEEWMSVIVLGHYQELPDLPEFKLAREQALYLLQRRSTWWWEPACIYEDHRDTPHSCTPVTYRIRIDRLSGLRATPEIVPAKAIEARESPVSNNWFASLFGDYRRARSKRRNLQ